MFILSDKNTIANSYIAELRDVEIQKDPLRFRRNIERLGEIMAYEISKELDYSIKDIQTPLAIKKQSTIDNQPILCTVLRAGLPFHQGFLSYFDRAQSSFLGAWREEGNGEIEIKLNYLASPSLENRELIIVDPMLATGCSLVKAIQAIKNHGEPKRIFIVAIIASPEGLKYVQDELPNAKLYICDVDEKLDENSYIVPGLGDAGDLAYGSKL